MAATWDSRLVASGTYSGAGQVLGGEGVFALRGTEAYEGWAFVGAWLDPMNGEPARVRGVIAEGEAPDLPLSPCGMPTFGWVHGPAAWLIDASMLRPPVLLPVCPLP